MTSGLAITGLGACGEVGRSCFLLDTASSRVLLDCGVGLDERPPSLDGLHAQSLDLVVLSHAHPDHVGFVPELCARGYRGPILATRPTRIIADRLWRHRCPPWSDRDRWERGRARAGRQWVELEPTGSVVLGDLRIGFRSAGHLVGSVMVEVWQGSRGLLYTGDFTIDSGARGRLEGGGRAEEQDYEAVICESTYGGVARPPRSEVAAEFVAEVVECVDRGGDVLIPSFGYGRTQELMRLMHAAPFATFPRLVFDDWVATANGLHRADVDAPTARQTVPPPLVPWTRSDRPGDDGPIVAFVAAAGTDRSTSALVDRFTASPHSLVAASGFVPPGSAVAHLIQSCESYGGPRIRRFEFSDHASGPELEQFLGDVAASVAYCVHGISKRAGVLRDAALRLGYLDAVVPEVLKQYTLW